MTKEERWADLWLRNYVYIADLAEAASTTEGVVEASIRMVLIGKLNASTVSVPPVDTDELQQRQGGEPDLSGYPEAIRGKHDKVYRSLWDKLTVPTELTGQERYTARGWMSCVAGLIRQRPNGLWERVPQGERA